MPQTLRLRNRQRPMARSVAFLGPGTTTLKSASGHVAGPRLPTATSVAKAAVNGPKYGSWRCQSFTSRLNAPGFCPEHERNVAAGGGDLHCPLDVLLAADSYLKKLRFR